MARVPFVPVDLSEPADVVDAMRARRNGKLNEVDRVLLHSPDFARGFNLLMGNVRHKLKISPFLRELAICGVGYLNDSDFEVVNHLPELRKLGASETQLNALSDFEAAAVNEQLFDENQRLIMRLTIEMTKGVKVSDETFAKLRRLFPCSQDIVEFVGTIASYNMAARMLVALGV